MKVLFRFIIMNKYMHVYCDNAILVYVYAAVCSTCVVRVGTQTKYNED